MSTISENLNRLVAAKNNIATSIAGKGVTVAETDGFEEYPALIDSIQAGGGITKADDNPSKIFAPYWYQCSNASLPFSSNSTTPNLSGSGT